MQFTEGKSAHGSKDHRHGERGHEVTRIHCSLTRTVRNTITAGGSTNAVGVLFTASLCFYSLMQLRKTSPSNESKITCASPAPSQERMEFPQFRRHI